MFIQWYAQFWFLLKDLGLDLSRKIFFILYSINRINFIVWLLLLHEKLDNIRTVIVSIPVCDVINFETLVFSSSHFLHNQKSQDKNLNILRTKRHITENKTHFSSFLKGSLLKQIKAIFFGRWEYIFKDELFNQWSIIIKLDSKAYIFHITSEISNKLQWKIVLAF